MIDIHRRLKKNALLIRQKQSVVLIDSFVFKNIVWKKLFIYSYTRTCTIP